MSRRLELTDEAVQAAAAAMTALLKKHPLPKEPYYGGQVGILHYSGPSTEEVARVALEAALQQLPAPEPFWRRVPCWLGRES